MKKENIDKLYQKELKDYSEVPDEKVWQAISASLDKKEKTKRGIPIWWKAGAAAALLAISFLIFNEINREDYPIEQITDTENNAPLLQEKDPLNSDIPSQKSDRSNEKINSPTSDNSNRSEGESKELNNALAETDKPNSKAQQDNVKDNVVVTPPASDTQDFPNNLEDINQDIAKNETEKNAPDDAAVVISNQDRIALDKDVLKKENRSNKENRDIDIQDSSRIASTSAMEDKSTEQLDNKKSIYEEIEKNKDLALVEENSRSKWELGPTIGPVYFNSFGTGSPIHSNFIPNSKSGNVNLSYGIGVAYQVGKKVKIRSGLNKVDYSYNTNDIAFSASFTASSGNQMDNINYVPTSQNLVVRSAEESRLLQESANAEIAAPNPSREGTMVQDFGYLELPLELNYAIIDKKFGFNIIGGISSLFLVNNSVVLESGVGEMEMGEANNLNDINLSTNIGLGFSYKFNPKIQLNIEPMFKYQLNTFSQTAGSFQPFSVGVFTGLNFGL